MAVRLSDRYSPYCADQQDYVQLGRTNSNKIIIDGMGRLKGADSGSSSSDELNVSGLSSSGCEKSWREADEVSSDERRIAAARFNILGKMQKRRRSPAASSPHSSYRHNTTTTQGGQINSDHRKSSAQSDGELCVQKTVKREQSLVKSRTTANNSKSPPISPAATAEDPSDSPLDFSNKRPRLEDCENIESKAEAPSSRLRNILSMKSPIIPENLAGTILNLSKESSSSPRESWMYPSKKSSSRSPSESGRSGSSSPVPMDHHNSSSEFLPSSPTQPEITTGGITLKNGGLPQTNSPLSVSTTLASVGYPPYGVLNGTSLSPVMNQTVPTVALPLPYETSPPLLTHHISTSATSPNLPFGSALSGSVPTSGGAGAKGRATRPFKAYPKDPMSFSAIGMYGLPLGTSPGSTEALIHQQSNAAYAEFRKQMLSQTQSSRSRRGGSRNGSESNISGDTANSKGNCSSNEDSHSANEEGGKCTKTEQQLKDEAYWERRRKNNEAAKRSRDARRAKEDEIAIRAAFLEQENLKLRFELCALKSETAKLRCMLYSS